MFRGTATMLAIAMAAFPAAGAASGPSPRYVVSAAEVAAALNTQGFAASAEQVTMLAEIVAVRPHPALEVRSVASWDGQRSRVELGCRSGAECLPFYVLVDGPDGGPAQRAARAFHSLAAPGGASAGVAKARAGTPTLKAGAHATLLIDQDGLHIRVPVVCLENGQVGKRIRVRGEVSRQISVAEVVDGASVKGSL